MAGAAGIAGAGATCGSAKAGIGAGTARGAIGIAGAGARYGNAGAGIGAGTRMGAGTDAGVRTGRSIDCTGAGKGVTRGRSIGAIGRVAAEPGSCAGASVESRGGAVGSDAARPRRLPDGIGTRAA
jgi:hypothetical protein